MTALTAWQSFYVIVGSSAGALIGLQFVVITLIAQMAAAEDGALASSAFATPTVIHFGAALLLSAILNVPWTSIGAAAIVWGLLGLGGIVYEMIVARRMRKTRYQPEFEDWLFHLLLPFAAYATLAAAAGAARSHLMAALFAVGAAALLLLFVGIHNAWDAVTYHVFVRRRQQQESESRAAN